MKLFYRTYGSGPPIIILHGIFGMSDNWVTFAKQLANGFEVFIPDLRNHGRSPHSNEFDYNYMLNDLRKFILEQNLHNIVLIGHSMGGKVAMQFALYYQELIKKLIVLDVSASSYNPTPEIEEIVIAINTIELKKANDRANIKRQLSGIIHDDRIIEFMMKNIVRHKNNVFEWKFNAQAISDNLNKLLKGIETDNKFDKPALFVAGGKSNYMKQEDIYMIFENFPEAQLELIMNAGHWLHVDAREELLNIVTHFIGD